MSIPQPATRIAERLAAAGTSVAFGIPGGGQSLDTVGAFQSGGIRFVLAHGETAAGIMASTWGHLSKAPGAVVVTRGPGATSVVNAAAQATLDRHPLVVIADTVPSDSAAGLPHQRIDQLAMFAPITKMGARVSSDTAEQQIDELLTITMTEPPGAVHLDCDPSWTGQPDNPNQWRSSPRPPVADLVVNDLGHAAELVGARITAAKRPIVIVGLAATSAGREIRAAVERLGAPILSTYQGVGVIPSGHQLDGGLFTNGASERDILEQADLIITIGLDMVEPIPAPWTVPAPVISLSAVPTVDPYLPIEIEVVGDLSKLVALIPVGSHDWQAGEAATHRLAVLERLRADAVGFAPTSLVETLLTALEVEASNEVITTVDAGAHFLAIMPFYPAKNPGDLLISNGLATMGYAVPAAIGASLARPGRPVVALVGDGGLSMVLGELETIVRLDVPITVVVLNDSALSLIEIKQNEHGGGDAAVRYRSTDFAAIANGMGLEGVVVRTAEEFATACETGFDRPRLIDARIDPHQYRNLIQVTRG